MLIGAHVSPAGGPANAVARGVERGCDAIQIFNQNPRAWKPTVYSDEQVADFREAMDKSRVDALLIHAVYLLNAATTDKEMRAKTRASLIASLRAGDALGAHAVVLHPGSALAGKVAPAIKRAGKVIAQALSESEHCALHLENTAGTGGTLGRSFQELADLIDAAGASKRLGLCLDSCHLFASGYDIRTEEGLAAGARRVRRGGRGARPSARCTSTTRRRRWAPTAIATPTSARASSAAAAAPSSSRSRASTDCPACSRRRAPTATVRRASRSRSRGGFAVRARAGVVRPGDLGVHKGLRPSAPGPTGARWCTTARKQRRRPPAPGPAVERGVARAKVADTDTSRVTDVVLLHRKKAGPQRLFERRAPPERGGA